MELRDPTEAQAYEPLNPGVHGLWFPCKIEEIEEMRKWFSQFSINLCKRLADDVVLARFEEIWRPGNEHIGGTFGVKWFVESKTNCSPHD